jgi:hypothetical protein
VSSDGITPDSERLFFQTLSTDNFAEELIDSDADVQFSLSATISGLIDNHIEVTISGNDSYSDNRAVIGKVIEINSDYDEGTILELRATITSLYSEENIDELVICEVGEDGLNPLETQLADEFLSANVFANGTYLVINVREFLLSLGIDVLSNIDEPSPIFMALRDDFEPAAEEARTSDNNSVYESRMGAHADELTSTVFNAASFDVFRAFSAAASSSAMGVADIVFAIDATGSMGDEINNVAVNVKAFAEQLVNVHNVNANFALIEYQDIQEDGIHSTIIHKNGISNWYSDVTRFKSAVNAIVPKDGGDEPESAIDVLETARLLDFRGTANKFVILITDAGYKIANRYGIASMEEMINRLVSDKIVTSVVTSSSQRRTYENLYSTTGGIYANIYEDFDGELLTLAASIGEIVNDGSWVFLDDFQAVKLAESPTGSADTDGDGIKDVAELGSKKTVDLTWAIIATCKANGVNSSLYSGVSAIDVYNYTSNPILVDTDYDGITDPHDMVKRDKGSVDGNKFTGKVSFDDEETTRQYDVEYVVDYKLFFDNNAKYTRNLSVLGALYSALIYDDATMADTTGWLYATTGSGADTVSLMNIFGMEDTRNYKLSADYHDDDISEIAIGHKNIVYKGREKEIIIVSVRGTNGTIEEWSSNFDVGADTSDYYDKLTGGWASSARNEWLNKTNHKGFDVAANRIKAYIESYVSNYVDSSTDKVLFITGHSRGAAIANILGARFEGEADCESFVYTFATPNTTTSTNPSRYRTIFNVVNSDDLIPMMPLSSWGFARYGTTKSISVAANYEDSSPFGNKMGTFEWLLNMDYNDDSGTARTIGAFEKTASTREAIYRYDDSDIRTIYYKNVIAILDVTKASNEAAELRSSYTPRMRQYVKVGYYDDPMLGIHQYWVYSQQTPAFFMMSLAELTAGPERGAFGIGYDVALKYVVAKTSFVASSGKVLIGGMFHPHWPATYYLIARNDFQSLK